MSHLESVDNALKLILILSQGRRLTVTEAARELQIAPSTAHRLLRTLVHRHFAQQAGDRSYGMGPALASMRGTRRIHTRLLDLAEPQLVQLTERTKETSHLAILVNREIRFLASVESHEVLRIGSRAGEVLGAHVTAAGRVLLADLAEGELELLYPRAGLLELNLAPDRIAALHKDIALVRRRGYAVNKGQSERGLSAVAMAIRRRDGRALAALTVSMPTVRYSSAKVEVTIEALRAACLSLAGDLAN
ncbi:MAG: IclR family transcriptional regulator [Tetrasphaera sp.]